MGQRRAVIMPDSKASEVPQEESGRRDRDQGFGNAVQWNPVAEADLFRV